MVDEISVSKVLIYGKESPVTLRFGEQKLDVWERESVLPYAKEEAVIKPTYNMWNL